MTSNIVLRTSDDLLMCVACGTQFDVTASSHKTECRICDDPRQFVPASGQAFTTMKTLREDGYRNVWTQDAEETNVWFVQTEPNFAIGERAILIRTQSGNVLWDLIPFLDQETVDQIEHLGGIKAIVISHPHYYSTWADWSRTFACPVYTGAPDAEWLERRETPGAEIRLLSQPRTSILLPDSVAKVTAILAGGHFPGSLVLLWNDVLFIADTIFASPSGSNPVPGRPGVISFTMFWSYPNRIPLHPDGVLKVWRSVQGLEFRTCFGAFKGQDVRTMENESERGTGGVKGRLLESCKIFVKAMGWREDQHEIFNEAL